MRYNLRPTTQFRKDLKRMQKRGVDISLLKDVLKKLAAGEPLPEKNMDHMLFGDYKGHRECHINSDWLLIYRIVEKQSVVSLISTGSHSDLF